MIRIKLKKHFAALLFIITVAGGSLKAQYNIVWTDTIGVSVDNGTTDSVGNIITYSSVTKTAASGWNNSGATSENFFPPDETNSIEYTVTQQNQQYSIGLSTSSSGGNPQLIDYAFNFQSNNKFNISENGIAKTAFVNFNVGDKFQILRTGGSIHYKRYNVMTGNWTKIRNSNQLASGDLRIDVTIFAPGFTIKDISPTKGKRLRALAGPDHAKCPGVFPVFHIGTPPVFMGGVPPLTFLWAPSTGLNSSNIAMPVANPSVTTLYTLTVTDNAGSTATDNVLVTIYPLPVIIVGATSTKLCQGSTATLIASGALTYSWAPATGLNTTTGATVLATPLTTTTYTVTGTDANGCTNTATKTITVETYPIVSVTPVLTTVCQGVSTILTASGASTYTWSPNIGLSSTSGASVTATPPATITYTVSGSNGGECHGTATATIIVNPLPDVQTSIGSALVCSGDNINITATGAVTYSWSPSTYLNTTSGANVTATPTSNITYTVTGTDANGCVNTATTVITISPDPIVTVSPDVTICIGSSAPLTASGAFSYAWLPSTGLSSTIGASVIASPTVTTTYTVTGSNAEKCTGTAVVTVTVNPLPIVSITPVNSTINLGNIITLTASGTATYSWSPSTGLDATSGAVVNASPIVNTTYTVTGSDAAGCTATATSVVNINPLEVDCNDCLPSFAPYPSRKYLLSAWAKQDGASPTITSYTTPKITVSTTIGALSVVFTPSGAIIDGWQKIEGEFTIPGPATDITIQLESTGGDVYFDDIRVFPFDGSMKSYVYDPVNMRLMAELDERNYATLYEYDEEGKLVRVKKETERGIMTIKENRNNTSK